MYKLTWNDIQSGNFPLTHDCILKVRYINGSPIRFEYFTCGSLDSARIADLLLKSSMVASVKFSSVDELPDTF